MGPETTVETTLLDTVRNRFFPTERQRLKILLVVHTIQAVMAIFMMGIGAVDLIYFDSVGLFVILIGGYLTFSSGYEFGKALEEYQRNPRSIDELFRALESETEPQ